MHKRTNAQTNIHKNTKQRRTPASHRARMRSAPCIFKNSTKNERVEGWLAIEVATAIWLGGSGTTAATRCNVTRNIEVAKHHF